MFSFKKSEKPAKKNNGRIAVILIAVMVALLCYLNGCQIIFSSKTKESNITNNKSYPFSMSEIVKLIPVLPPPLMYQTIGGESTTSISEADVSSEELDSDDDSEDHIELTESEENTEVEEADDTSTVEEESADEEPVEETPTSQEYVVSGDETLWEIAEYFYGDGKYCPSIAIENDIDITNPVIYDGMVLNIPTEIDETLTYDNYISSLASEDTGTEMTYFGNFKITGYDIYCSHCCNGSTSGITSSGIQAVPGRTVAVSSSYGIAAGTRIYIEDYGYYVVEDSGCLRGYVDIACTSHSECYALTSVGTKAVYIIND